METAVPNVMVEFETPAPNKRPTFLTVICVLSFIWEGLMILFGILGVLFVGSVFKILGQVSSGDSYEQMSEMQRKGLDQLMDLGEGTVAIILGVFVLINVISLVSVILMWKLKKTGFYIYSVLNGLIVVLNLIQFDIFMTIMGIAFIVMYAMNLKHMKN